MPDAAALASRGGCGYHPGDRAVSWSAPPS